MSQIGFAHLLALRQQGYITAAEWASAMRACVVPDEAASAASGRRRAGRPLESCGTLPLFLSEWRGGLFGLTL